MLLDLDRSTGIPPNHLKNHLNGIRNRASFPSQYILVLKINIMNKPYRKSQFDVCGAPTRTNLGISGNRPSIRHPAILKNNIENQRKSVFNTGVSKIVYCKPFSPCRNLNRQSHLSLTRPKVRVFYLEIEGCLPILNLILDGFI